MFEKAILKANSYNPTALEQLRHSHHTQLKRFAGFFLSSNYIQADM